MGTTGRNGIMAIAGVVCSVRCPAGDCETICREGAVTLPISWSPGIWLSSSGSIGASPILLPVTSTARTSGVCSSTPLPGHRGAMPCRAMEVDLAPNPSFRTAHCPAAHACMCERDACGRSTYYPAGACTACCREGAFALDLDPSAIDQEVQRTGASRRAASSPGDIAPGRHRALPGGREAPNCWWSPRHGARCPPARRRADCSRRLRPGPSDQRRCRAPRRKCTRQHVHQSLSHRR